MRFRFIEQHARIWPMRLMCGVRAPPLAAVEAEPNAWKQRFYEALEGFRFLPAGRFSVMSSATRSVPCGPLSPARLLAVSGIF